mgnify:CR=1 FL=1
MRTVVDFVERKTFVPGERVYVYAGNIDNAFTTGINSNGMIICSIPKHHSDDDIEARGISMLDLFILLDNGRLIWTTDWRVRKQD